MASIHPTRYGTWEVCWRENGRPKSKTLKKKGDADALRLRIEQRGSFMRAQDAPTFEEFGAKVVAGMDISDETRALYVQLLSTHAMPFVGHLSLVELKPRRWAEWQQQRLDDGAGPAAVGKTQTVISQILDAAVLPYEYVESNTINSLKPPPYEKRSPRWLTAGDVEALRMWFIEQGDLGSATLISVQAYVGIRPEDTLARMWADLDPRLSVTTKNVNGKIKPGSKSGMAYIRKVEVPEIVRQDLEEWRLASSGAGLIFPRRSDGLPWTKTDYDNWRSRHPKGKGQKRPRCFRRAAEEVGLGDKLRPYDLRHTAASLYAAAGWTAVEIAHQLGHSPTESQRTYQHLIQSDSRERGSVNDYIREARGLAPVRDSFVEEVR